jgi:hypothetical protein
MSDDIYLKITNLDNS